MLIKAAINGGRSKEDQASIPVTPEEQAVAVVECLAAGAHAIHLHVRSRSGEESLQSDDVATTLQAVKSVAPDADVGISTGAWIEPNPKERIRLASSWKLLPNFASVNFIEAGAAELARLLISRGIGVEAGLSDAKAAQIFVESGLAARCLRLLLEPQEQDLECARETVRRMETVLQNHESLPVTVLHGTEATAWPMLKDAVKHGYGVRIGFEDTLLLDDGTKAQSNAQLIAEALKLIRTSV